MTVASILVRSFQFDNAVRPSPFTRNFYKSPAADKAVKFRENPGTYVQKLCHFEVAEITTKIVDKLSQ